MTVQDVIYKLSEYNQEAEFNVVIDGFAKPFKIYFGSSEGVIKTNCENVDLMVGDISEEAGENEAYR